MPLVTAEKSMKSALVRWAMIRASVVLPTPGGPQKIMEETRSLSMSRRSTLPGPSRWVCPTIFLQGAGAQPRRQGLRRVVGEKALLFHGASSFAAAQAMVSSTGQWSEPKISG